VETVAERDALIDMGAVKGQGFLYHRPMPWAAALQLLESGGVCAVPAGR
jgi:EAL domain-containing protein (putative c-di-GMP-specific phosphodiesterase class I)